MLEHVRAQGKTAAWMQDALVPATTRLAGNCHWNRDTVATIRTAGFQIQHANQIRDGLLPIVSIVARRP
jgi:hypothetical protein